MLAWQCLDSDNCKETEIKFPIKKLQTTDINIIAYNKQGNYTNPSPARLGMRNQPGREQSEAMNIKTVGPLLSSPLLTNRFSLIINTL